MSLDRPRIAVIDDNQDLREELMFFLQHRNYSVWGAESAESFWKKLHRHPADIVLIDVGLPGEDGFSVVDYLNAMQGFGLIIITARGQKQDKLRGLNLGADLYLVKPVNFAELVSVIDTLWQRIQNARDVPDTTVQRRSDSHTLWQLLASSSCLQTGDACLKLSPQEYELLYILGHSAGEVFNRQTLTDLLFRHEDEPDPHRIDVILSRLRKKAKSHKVYLPIRSIFGRGLVFVGMMEILP